MDVRKELIKIDKATTGKEVKEAILSAISKQSKELEYQSQIIEYLQKSITRQEIATILLGIGFIIQLLYLLIIWQ